MTILFASRIYPQMYQMSRWKALNCGMGSAKREFQAVIRKIRLIRGFKSIVRICANRVHLRLPLGRATSSDSLAA